MGRLGKNIVHLSQQGSENTVSVTAQLNSGFSLSSMNSYNKLM